MQLLTVTFEHYPTILALLYLTIILLALIVIGFINQKSVLSGKLMGFMINKVQLQERIKELGDHIKKQDAEINTYLNNYEAAKEVITEFQMKYNGEVKEVCRLRTIIVEQGKQNEYLVLENNNLKEQQNGWQDRLHALLGRMEEV